MSMRLVVGLVLIPSAVVGFVPQSQLRQTSFVLKTASLEPLPPQPTNPILREEDESEHGHENENAKIYPLRVDPEVYKARQNYTLAKLRNEKDRHSREIPLEELKSRIIYEDEHIIVLNKPEGTLSCPGPVGEFPNLAEAVFKEFGSDFDSWDKMVVHRLGMDTSGLMVMVKTRKGMTVMGESFRTRRIKREYEALVCGHMEKDEGVIDLPLMKDYEFPPFMRVSTLKHQWALINLSPKHVGEKTLLQREKKCFTKYKVIAREELNGLPVTRVTLTSITGRYHQLNCHLATFGHPIVGDAAYGIGGDAAPNGGLSDEELEELAPNPNRAPEDLQKKLLEASDRVYIHAKYLHFRNSADSSAHVECTAPTPF